MAKTLDREVARRGEIPPPVASLIGFTTVSIEPGQAVIEFEATEHHANSMGIVHGGVLCGIADAPMGLAYVSTLEQGERSATLDVKMNFLKPVRGAAG